MVENTYSMNRRHFLKSATGAAAIAAGLGAVPQRVSATPLVLQANVNKPAANNTANQKSGQVAEDYVKLLHESLKPEQRDAICFPFNHPLRKKVDNNWHVVPQIIGDFLDADQQELCRQILKGVTTEDGYERFQKQMEDDGGGFKNYSCAIFGDPSFGGSDSNYQWVLTGRHTTIRADGNTTANTAFGGPIFYGHAVTFNEEPDHPGNVWWHQSRLANEVYKTLDGKQQKLALLDDGPADNSRSVRFQGDSNRISGLSAADMSRDQKEHLEKALKSLLSMFRESDVKEVMECLKKNGGLDRAFISFYKAGDIGKDSIWDRWRVEGPAFVWYFRGSPHVHTWVNVAHQGPKWI